MKSFPLIKWLITISAVGAFLLLNYWINAESYTRNEGVKLEEKVDENSDDITEVKQLLHGFSIEQTHMHEKLDDMRVEQKDDMNELKQLVRDN